MNFDDVFRSFFGFHGPRGAGRVDDDKDDTDFFNTPPNFGFFGTENYDDDDDEQDDLTFGRGHGGRFPSFGGDLFFRFEEDTHDMFRHFEEMFKNFGLTEFPSSAFSRIDQEPPPSSSSSSSRYQTPRDEMLKHPDSFQPSSALPKPFDKDRLCGDSERKPTSEAPSWFSLWNSTPKWHRPMPSLPPSAPHKEDQDLDDQVKGKKLDDILTPRDPALLPNASPGHAPTTKSYFRSVSVQTIRKPDGTVEQRRTERDAEGNVTTTVTSTNPTEPGTPPLMPNPRRPSNNEQARLRAKDKTVLGQAKTNSIFEKLFGSWGRD